MPSELIVKNYKFNRDEIFITYNAVDDKFKVYDRKPIEILKKYGIEGPFIFHLSRYSERKNPWTLLNSFKKIKEKKKDLQLVIGGKGWQNEETINFIRKNSLEKDIIFTGFIPKEDVVKLLNLAEVFVFPSLFEGFGIPNLEAMACGCPVITSRAFAIPEIVGNAALLLKDNKDSTELANKILQIIQNKDLRDKLVNKGLERIKSFSWEEGAKTLLDVYQRCLDS